MIYRPADEPLRSFFLNVLTCSTDLLLRKYGLPVCTFVMSYKEKGVTIARIDKNLPTISLKDNNKKKYLYGAEYMDFVYQKKNVIFVAAPIMTDEENKQAFFLARFRKPSPEFSRRKPDAIVYDSFDRSMLLDAV
jgi:hypothetical protein